ncbi:MAG: DUF3298 domain-containing protein [Fimbriimonadaceae bacterium]|nr:DUF3298 domain-containing protein [Fimbriimonadaceae bacterium]
MRRLLLLLLLVPLGASAQNLVVFKTEKAKKQGVWTLKIAVPNLKGTTPLATRFNAEVAKIVDAERKDFLPMVADNLKEFGKPSHPFAFDASGTVSCATPDFVSACIEIYTDAGGAHPNVTVNPINVRTLPGKAVPVRLKELLAPGASMQQVRDIVIEATNVEKRKRGADPLTDLEAKYLDLFVVTPAGVTWMFGPYTVGVYAEGAYHIKVPWSKLAGLVESPFGR